MYIFEHVSNRVIIFKLRRNDMNNSKEAGVVGFWCFFLGGGVVVSFEIKKNYVKKMYSLTNGLTYRWCLVYSTISTHNEIGE